MLHSFLHASFDEAMEMHDFMPAAAKHGHSVLSCPHGLVANPKYLSTVPICFLLSLNRRRH
jgi:hypothetical protein